MRLKNWAIFTVLLAIMLAPAVVTAKTSNQAGQNRPASPASIPPLAAKPSAASPTTETDREDGVRNNPPQIIVTNPAPVPVPLPWTLYERIAWAANLVLVVLAYVGIMLAVSALKKIERQTRYTETAAEAAAASAQAALLNAQAVINSERPWILVTVEPSPSSENSFTIMATNRGRTPARMIAHAERTRIAIDEEHLPSPPEYTKEEPKAPLLPIILLPGESTPIKQFSRGDVREICGTEEEFSRLETWEEKLFFYGKVTYRDLIAPADNQVHETNWCCWHIHGRRNSGLVMAGPPEYNLHT